MIANWLSTVEQRLAEGDVEDLAVAIVSLAYVAGTEIEIPEDERRGATRRALLLLAAGGDPSRGLDLDGRAVLAVATDLDTPERREALMVGLARLVGPASSLPHVREAVRGMRDEPEVAWRAYAASVLGEDL
jgi:hypothetical protein